MWIAPAVGVAFSLFCLSAHRSSVIGVGGGSGIGSFSIMQLAASILPVFAFFLTDIFRNKTIARGLYVTLVAGILYVYFFGLIRHL